MVLAIVLLVLGVMVGLGGLLFAGAKWLLVVAVVLLTAGVLAVMFTRGKARSLRRSNGEGTFAIPYSAITKDYGTVDISYQPPDRKPARLTAIAFGPTS